MNKLAKKGFTLIELLVVISIISLLATLAVTSLQNAQKKSRDVKRKADLKQISTALELYYDVYNAYPVVSGWVYSTGGDNWIPGLSPYLSKVPKDPKNNVNSPWGTGNYTYAYGYSTGSYPNKYDLVAQLENTGDNDRCAVKCWKYHTGGGENPWCSGCGSGRYSYSPYLYASH